MAAPQRGSIVIPAHNEAGVIRRCLDALYSGGDLSRVEVIVACNGCTDDTAAVARATEHPVRVLETTTASKAAALRMADSACAEFPRIYLDADIVLTGRAAIAVLRRLDTADVVAGRPPIRYDAARSSWPVRSYYRARARVPALMGSLWGAGVYAMSGAARARFDEFPDMVGDDLYVDSLYRRDEIVIVDTDPVVVNVPRRLRSLLTILRRTYRGNAEQQHLASTAVSAPTSSSAVAKQVVATARSPRSAADAIMYLVIATSARVLAAARPAPRWERDDSSRTA